MREPWNALWVGRLENVGCECAQMSAGNMCPRCPVLICLEERHTQPQKILGGIPMHHVLASVYDMKIHLWLHLFKQLSAFASVGAVFAAKYHQ